MNTRRLAALAATALLVTACGSDDSDAATTEAPAASGTADASVAPSTGDGDGERSTEEAEVTELFEDYEANLLRNDVEAMNAVFLDSDEVLRFGIADMQFDFDELVAWRAAATPVSQERRITHREVLQLAPGVVAVDITFVNGDEPMVGRQSQTWVKGADGWRIVRAHVSVIPS